MIQALDKAIQYMSKRRIGALMTIEMNTGLEDYIETGIPLDADVSGELLINIFIPNTPLHDGAVIIKNNRIAVAAAYLPLSESNLIPKELGTRHRAAVGISEVTDALTIVISEETGAVTITKNNELIRNLTRQDYLKLLHNELVPAEEKKQKNTDALTIVISEETGAVTITKNNELIRNLTRQDYLKLLHNELVPAEEKKQKNIREETEEYFCAVL